MKIYDLDTPSLVIDLNQVERNIRDMRSSIRSEVQIRPHAKTHKTPFLSHKQLQMGASGISVAKISEAEVFAAAGVDDILVANLLIGKQKIHRFGRLAQTIRIKTVVDSIEGATMLSEIASLLGVEFSVFLDVNTGLNRTGVAPENALQLAKKIAILPGVKLCGVFSYAGFRTKTPTPEVRKQWAVTEATTAVDVANDLKRAGIPTLEVSVGGTATAPYVSEVPGVTEVRPGTYIFYDMMSVQNGFCAIDQCAARVHASVISRPDANRGVLDVGSKVLTSDKRVSDVDYGFGYLPQFPGVKIASLWEEHAVLLLDEDGRQLQVGDTVEIVPNHICPVVNLFREWYASNGEEVVGRYEVAARGMTT